MRASRNATEGRYAGKAGGRHVRFNPYGLKARAVFIAKLKRREQGRFRSNG